MVMTPQEFAAKFYAALEAEHWGDIEPDVFRNIAEGVTKPSEMWTDKLDRDEMADAVASMKAILERIL